MAIIRSRSVLIIDAVKRDNPGLEHLDRSNTWVYRFREELDGRMSCLIHGRYGMGAYGRLRVKYNKLDVDVMTKECDKGIPLSAAMSTVGVLATINELFGFALKYDEIIDHRIEGGVIILEPKANSSLYRGRTEFQFVSPGPSLAGIITDREMDISAMDTYGLSTQLVGSVLTMGHDYTEFLPELSALAVNDVIDQAAATLLSPKLKTIDGVSWGVSTGAQWTLVDARVVYNGNTADATNPMVSKKFDKVLILQLPTGVGFSDAAIVFHYNTYSTIWS